MFAAKIKPFTVRAGRICAVNYAFVYIGLYLYLFFLYFYICIILFYVYICLYFISFISERNSTKVKLDCILSTSWTSY